MVNKQKRKRLELEERRDHLLHLGKKLFGRLTYDQISITDIAKAARISKGLLYHYFPNKRVFYVATVRAAAAEMLRVSSSPEADNPAKSLQYTLESYLKYVEENASAYLALLRSGVGVDPEVAEIIDHVRATYYERIKESLGLEDPTDEQVLALRGCVGFIEAMSTEWLKNKTLTVRELCILIEKHLRPLLEAL
jgi:AcrR family transcriptional regulator